MPFWGAGALAGTLPAKIGNTTFGDAQTIDDQYNVGHSIDPVLRTLGKSRDDATAVFRYSTDGADGVGAWSVAGIAASAVMDAMNTEWNSASVVTRSHENIDGRDVMVLVERAGTMTGAWAVGDAVYVVETADEGRFDEFVRALPK